MLNPFTLAGLFVRLEPLTLDHADALVRAGNVSRETYQYTIVPGNYESAVAFVKTALAEAAANQSVPFATSTAGVAK